NIIIENNISSAVNFTDPPESATYIQFRQLRITDPTNENPPDFRADKNGIFDGSGLPTVGIGELPYDFDFTYATTDESYTAAEGGFPLGDLNWFPDRKADWIATGSEEVAELPSRLQLHGNYPNPFIPSTTIRFDLAAPAEVSVAVYDVLGRRVLSVPGMTMAAGVDQTIRVDAFGLSSGVYFYQVLARMASRTEVRSGQMVLLK
ncbi:MAG TPA: T9SS type A sorting domain-containing protein, partial [Rhodothermales bacterium]